MKKLLYAGFFGFIFLISLYLTFPIDALRPAAEKAMTQALEASSPGAQVHIGELGLWRLSGFSLSNLKIEMGSGMPEPGPALQIEEFKIRLGIFSLLRGKLKIEFAAHIYAGWAGGHATLTPEGSLSELSVDIQKIDIQKLRGPLAESALKATGQIHLNADLDLGKNPAKDGSGNLALDLRNLSIGPGVFEIPGGFGAGLTLPLIKLGQMSGKISFQKGKSTIKDWKLVGGDLEAHVNANLELADNILFSPLKGSGWFTLKKEFQKANPKIASLLELSPDIKAAEDAEGRVHFTLIGSLMAPTPKWGKGD